MFNFLTILIVGFLANAVWSDFHCDPTLVNNCPPDPAVNGIWIENFESFNSNWSNTTEIQGVWNGTGLHSIISEPHQDCAYNSNLYIMFGHLTAVVNHPNVSGIDSQMTFRSDNGDDTIFFFWKGHLAGSAMVDAGGLNSSVSANNSYLPDSDFIVNDGRGQFNTYEIEWTSERIVWTINGQIVRQITPSQVQRGNGYPQTPMFVFFEINDARLTSGGDAVADWSKGPFAMNVRSMNLVDYSTGNSYSYLDKSSTLASIKSNGGSVNGTSLGVTVAAGTNVTSTSLSSATASVAVPRSSTSSNSQSTSTVSSGNPSLPPGLSPGAQAGIGVGAGLAGLAILIGTIVLWRKRRTPTMLDKYWRDKGGLALDGEPGESALDGEPGVAVD